MPICVDSLRQREDEQNPAVHRIIDEVVMIADSSFCLFHAGVCWRKKHVDRMMIHVHTWCELPAVQERMLLSPARLTEAAAARLDMSNLEQLLSAVCSE